MSGTEQQWSDYISIVIAVVAVLVSIVFGLSNRGIARRALKISERAEARRTPRLDLLLHTSAMWRSTQEAAREYGVHLQITNPTDLQTAVDTAELHIIYSRADHEAVVKVPIAKPPRLAGGIETIELPQRVEANDAVSGWLVFHVQEELVRETDVHRYDLVVGDVHDLIVSMQIIVFPEKPSSM